MLFAPFSLYTTIDMLQSLGRFLVIPSYITDHSTHLLGPMKSNKIILQTLILDFSSQLTIVSAFLSQNLGLFVD